MGGRLVRVLAAGAALLPAQWRLPAAGGPPAAQGDHPVAAGDRGRDFLPVAVLQHLLRQAHAHQCADHRLGGKQSPDDAGVPGVDRGSGCRAGAVVPHGEGGLPSLVQGDCAACCSDCPFGTGDRRSGSVLLPGLRLVLPQQPGRDAPDRADQPHRGWRIQTENLAPGAHAVHAAGSGRDAGQARQSPPFRRPDRGRDHPGPELGAERLCAADHAPAGQAGRRGHQLPRREQLRHIDGPFRALHVLQHEPRGVQRRPGSAPGQPAGHPAACRRGHLLAGQRHGLQGRVQERGSDRGPHRAEPAGILSQR